MRYVIPSALAIMAAVDFFSVRSISKVINRKQNGHIVLHGLYHSRKSRSCAGDKIEHQNVYKRHSSSSGGTYVYKRGRLPQTRDLWRNRASMG